ncbi:MAG TPA: thioesterase family protein [Allosphingosinicella sp.]|nr:thioesterase family protein [Allosphingosinicella sp.]
MSRPPLLARSSYPYFRTITTRWADNDSYGHVNNTVYYGWFDSAVNAWLIEAGLLDVARGNPIGLVVETGCRYARPLSFPEPVEIGLAAEQIGRSSVRYRLGVFATAGEQAAAEGHFVHVYVDRDSRRPVELPFEWRRKLESVAVKVTENS